ncbi:MAG: hypothetical protein J6M39_05400 [Lachnospiraceae bacterium]|nr:hypothetical protein [Lachnospiraceae bacterium]
MKAFNTLSKKELEKLRKMGSIVNKSLNFKITSKEFDDAKKHLEKIYGKKVYRPFVERMILLNKV